MLIITDNYGQRGIVEESRALENPLDADLIVSAVTIPNPGESRRTKNPVTTNWLAGEAGGDTLRVDDPGEACQQMIEWLRNRYSMCDNRP